jgi:hypothetical protein
MPLELSGDIAGLGKIVQIVRATDTTFRSTSSTTYTDVPGMSVTITPTKSDSTLLILTVASAGVYRSGTAQPQQGEIQITDSSNSAISGAEGTTIGMNSNTTLTELYSFHSITLVGYASPSTTSAVTYKTRYRAVNSSSVIRFQNQASTGQMFAIEVAA